MVNLISFFILRKLQIGLNAANLISIILAVLFAYVVNSRFVFQDKCERLLNHVRPFGKFLGARFVTMLVEIFGVWLFVTVMQMNDMLGKTAVQLVVLVLNYIFSRFFVFTTGKRAKETK